MTQQIQYRYDTRRYRHRTVVSTLRRGVPTCSSTCFSAPPSVPPPRPALRLSSRRWVAPLIYHSRPPATGYPPLAAPLQYPPSPHLGSSNSRRPFSPIRPRHVPVGVVPAPRPACPVVRADPPPPEPARVEAAAIVVWPRGHEWSRGSREDDGVDVHPCESASYVHMCWRRSGCWGLQSDSPPTYLEKSWIR